MESFSHRAKPIEHIHFSTLFFGRRDTEKAKEFVAIKNYVGRFFVSSSVFQLTAINVQLSHFQLNCEKRLKEIVRGLGKIIMISKGHNGI